ncbi:Meckel syndrome type 1 protein isoform X2 [Agrilus planipennis]|uniref:Meckel syndrome type 1 protein isoform X2 n=1 Tax=Agrilus planipennis TaxID=224129 RepID=A0A7F5RCD1_AGRPL|nr:Meckel syndrome type 1 protein isoform X2 [Agrilus planipennis]
MLSYTLHISERFSFALNMITLKELPSNNSPEDGREESKVFQWQEKVYSKSERLFYENYANCLSDSDRKHHDNVQKQKDYTGLFFTYVSDDSIPEESPLNNTCVKSDLVNKMETLKLINDNGFQNYKNYDFETSIQNAINNPVVGHNFEKYQIMADFGRYIDDIWIKNEFILCTIKYDRNNQILVINPDFSEADPYLLEFEDDKQYAFVYRVEDVSENIKTSPSTTEEEICEKMIQYRHLIRKRKIGTDFELPPLNKMRVFIFLEILAAKDFEYNDIYVEYLIDLPKRWSCSDNKLLTGRTQSCHSYLKDNLSFFGSPFEIILEYNLVDFDAILEAPCIYFEVVSKDGWNRYRTEGLAYLVLPVSQPGIYSCKLNCLRMKGAGPLSELRRFFIGDYRGNANIEWINIPKDYEDTILNKFGSYTVGTGQLDVRFNIINQSQAFLDELGLTDPQNAILDKLRCSSLIKTVEQVLQSFKEAKKKMIEARRNV